MNSLSMVSNNVIKYGDGEVQGGDVVEEAEEVPQNLKLPEEG